MAVGGDGLDEYHPAKESDKVSTYGRQYGESKCLHGCGVTLFGKFPIRIPCHLPQMPVGVLKRATVATPESIVRRVGDDRACLAHLCHDRIHFGLARDIVAERELSGALRPQRNLGLMGDVCARSNGQFQAVLEIEKCNSAMFELRADDAPSRQTESIPIEFQRSLQIVDTKSNDRDPWLHSRTITSRWRTRTKKCETGYVSERKVSTSGSWDVGRHQTGAWHFSLRHRGVSDVSTIDPPLRSSNAGPLMSRVARS